jgi:uncharacterized protein
VKFQHHIAIDAPRERVWQFLMDVPSVARCLPGLEEITAEDADRYIASVKIRVGPISLTLRSELAIVERDEAAGRAVLTVNSFDKRAGGGAKARLEMSLVETEPGKTGVTLVTDAQIMGKLGNFGQAIIQKKADQIVAEAARNIAAELEKQPTG